MIFQWPAPESVCAQGEEESTPPPCTAGVSVGVVVAPPGVTVPVPVDARWLLLMLTLMLGGIGWASLRSRGTPH